MPFREISDPRQPEASATIRERVCRAREVQERRFAKRKGFWVNSRMQPRDLEKHCRLGDEAHALLEKAAERLALSARSCHRVLKISRTIADLDNQPDILVQTRGRGHPVPPLGAPADLASYLADKPILTLEFRREKSP